MQFKYNQQQVTKTLKMHYCLSAGPEFYSSEKSNRATIFRVFQFSLWWLHHPAALETHSYPGAPASCTNFLQHQNKTRRSLAITTPTVFLNILINNNTEYLEHRVLAFEIYFVCIYMSCIYLYTCTHTHTHMEKS